MWGRHYSEDSVLHLFFTDVLHLFFTDVFALDSCKIFFGKGKSVNTSFACGNTSNKTNLGKVSLVLSYLIFYYHSLLLIFYYHSLLLTHITWPVSSWVLLGRDSQQKHALPSLYEKAGKSQICRAADSLVPWKCLIPPGDTSIWWNHGRMFNLLRMHSLFVQVEGDILLRKILA